MRILIVILAIITTILSAKESNIKYLNIENDGVEIAILYPKKIYKGDTIKIGAIMLNRNATARAGGLTLSFPQFKYSKLAYADNTFDDISTYSPPDKIYSGIKKRNIRAQYFMVEGWERKWHRGVAKTFYVEIKLPKNLDELVINVRGVLVFGKGRNKHEIKVPASSHTRDQQGYPVKRVFIPIINHESGVIAPKNNMQRNSSKEQKSAPKKENNAEGSTGTGFFINSNTVLTNNHVVEGCKDLEVVQVGYKTKAELITKDATNDLAVIRTQKSGNGILEFKDSKKVRIGESIVAIGYPLGDLLGNNIKLTTGNISSLNGLLNDFTKLQFTAPVQPGNSGGPLLNNKGAVIGVVYAKLKNNIAQNVSLAIKDNVAKMFLDANDIEYKINQNNQKLEVVDIADSAKKGIVQVICR